ncbi:MAG: DUF3034 family protein [Panacagrimonas sp.]
MKSKTNMAATGVTRALQGAAVLAAGLFSASAHAGFYNDGKVLLTGGVVTIDGGGGGGITPWAVISGYGTRDGVNAGLHYTFAYLPDYSLNSYGITVGFYDRFELSFTRSTLPTGGTFDTVGLVASLLAGTSETGVEPFNTTIEMDVIGAKLRLFGDAVYTSDSIIPQVAIGGYYKDNKNADLLHTLQAQDNKDWEAYISATKVYFPFSTLINITGRYTRANQTGLTGFGGPGDDDRELRLEASIAVLVAKNTVFGGEFAQHGKALDNVGVNVNGILVKNILDALPLELIDRLGVTELDALNNTLTQKEDDWYDLFFAFAPNKRISFVIAYAMLGDITLTPDQHGFYFSTHLTF